MERTRGIMLSHRNNVALAVLEAPQGMATVLEVLMHPQSNRVPNFPANLDDYAPWVAAHGLVAPYGKCQCGCGEEAPIANKTEHEYLLVEGHPKRFVYNHHLIKRSLRDAFWSHVVRGAPEECWEWHGSVQPSGYGSVSFRGKTSRAHRVSYAIHFGEIPGGMHVLHKCDNPRCVNPFHLRLGTHADNMADRNRKGRQARGERSGSAKMSNEQVVELLALAKLGVSSSKLAERYGISDRHARMIVVGKKWKHLRTTLRKRPEVSDE